MSDEHHDVVIIKRGGGDHEEGHHGGAWKIAFADFMTAMMAFFLVMWLISANDKTKAVIAKYFNPIELVDSTPQPRGLSDPKKDDPNIEHKPDADAKDDGAKGATGAKAPTHGSEGKHGKEEVDASKAAPAPASAAPHPDAPPLDDADHSPSHAEVELIRDPYAVLAEIAEKSADAPKAAAEKTAKASEGAKADGGKGEGGKENGGKGAVGATGGEAFRDPYQPQAVAAGRDPFAIPTERPEPKVAGLEPTREALSSPPETAASKPAPEPVTSEGAKPAANSAPAAAPAAGHAPARIAGSEPAALPPSAVSTESASKPLAPAALRNEIVAAARALDPSPAHAAVPGVEVRRTDEGVLISLTDSANYAMFPSASARPSARSVALMATVGKLLASQKGAVVVRGYTDGRPFRSDVYDNWRLSSERAHIAHYMLMRGGLEEARIDRIEGYADRHPRNAKDLAAPENRRIEILLREAAP